MTARASKPCRLEFGYSLGMDELSTSVAWMSDSLLSRHMRDRGESRSVRPLGGPWLELPPLGGHLVYLNAERLGPRKLYDRSEVFARHCNLGYTG